MIVLDDVEHEDSESIGSEDDDSYFTAHEEHRSRSRSRSGSRSGSESSDSNIGSGLNENYEKIIRKGKLSAKHQGINS